MIYLFLLAPSATTNCALQKSNHLRQGGSFHDAGWKEIHIHPNIRFGSRKRDAGPPLSSGTAQTPCEETNSGGRMSRPQVVAASTKWEQEVHLLSA